MGKKRDNGIVNRLGVWSALAVLFIGLLAAVQPVSSASGDVVINEVMVSNGAAVFDSSTQNFSDWVELYNTTSNPIDLNGYWLSDNPQVKKQWQIKNIVIAPFSHQLLWADGRDFENHANFKLKHGGEILILSNPSGVEVARLDYRIIPQLPDVSYGRTADGGNNWAYFSAESVTPGQSNNGAASVPNVNLQLKPPVFNLAGGFYSGSQTIRLSLAESVSNAEIRYTLDGSIPTRSSALYTGSFTVSASGNIVAPMVRARVFAPGRLPSVVKTETYFLDVWPPSESDLWRVSITINPAYLFDNAIGIYVPGNTFDPLNPDWSGNYFQDWERPMHIEVYEPGAAQIFQFDGGVKINGSSTRKLPIKTLHIKTGNEYGSEDLRYKIFETSPVDDFPSFLLRSSGNDQWATMFRDGFLATLAHQHMNLDVMAYRPAVVYINGQYWGIQNFREKLDEVYFQEHYGTDIANLDLLGVGTSAEREIVGSKDDYEAMVNFARTNDLTNNNNYAQMHTVMDVDSFIDYMTMEIYIANTDWPDNNVKMWRDRGGENRWRWFLFDLDAGFNLAGSNKYNLDSLQALTHSSATNWPRVVPLFNRLLTNPSFKNEFVQTFAAHINITFEPGNVINLIDEMQNRIAADMEGHVQRWDDPSSMSAWRNRVNTMRNFANLRPAYMWEDLELEFGLSRYWLTINKPLPGSGQIYVQDVLVPVDNFQGEFFQNVPVRLRAEASPGYHFVRWQDSSGTLTTNPELTINRSSAYTVQAIFIESLPLVINEIHYNPSADLQGIPGQLDESFEFVELYNPNNFALNLAGFSFTNGFTFTFPSGATLPQYSYTIVARDAAAYSNMGISVYQWAFGGLNNTGETITLADNFGNELDTVTYDDGATSSWTTAPDGNGVSLALNNVNLENSLPINWSASHAVGGTPGRANNAAVMFHPIVINEIFYKPPIFNNDDEALEFVELVNTSTAAIDLSGYAFTDGIDYVFPAGTTLAANECLLLVNDAAAYPSLNGKVQLFQWDSGKLSDNGELLRLVNFNNNKLVDALIYQNVVATGRSLELIGPGLDNTWATNWEASKYSGGTPCRANNDDEAAVTLAVMHVDEGTISENWLAFQVQLSYPMGIPVSVDYTTANGSARAGEDYQAVAGTLSFAPGQTQQTVFVPTIPDSEPEADETVLIVLSNPQALTLVDSVIQGIIANDDGTTVLPPLSAADTAVAEGHTEVHTATVTLSLSQVSSKPVTVSYTTADGTAIAGTDYQPTYGTVVFHPGQTTKTVAVKIFGDEIVEADETIKLRLTNSVNAALSKAEVIITILDDDTAGALPTITVQDVAVDEQNAGMQPVTLTLNLSMSYTATVTVDYTTADLSAIAGEDYQAISGQVVFMPTETVKTITVYVIGDTNIELDEAFMVTLSNAANATLTNSQANIVVRDDDGGVSDRWITYIPFLIVPQQ